ncbi:MAG: protease complex subunit PrcB family protein [Sphingobacteriaceae bacterium]|nr:protease complex subunit PrcB family protein [Sphingobacteriaceae bacterium]
MKHFLKFFSALLFATALLMGCASNKPKLLTFEYLPSDFQSMYNEKGANIYVINNDNEMQEVLKELQMQPINEVDYSFFYQNNSLVLIYGGMQRTTGYKVDLQSVTLTKGKLQVLAELHTPGEGCLMGDMITYPVQLIAIEKIAGKDVSLDMPVVAKPCR